MSTLIWTTHRECLSSAASIVTAWAVGHRVDSEHSFSLRVSPAQQTQADFDELKGSVWLTQNIPCYGRRDRDRSPQTSTLR